ncbi:MAG: efflux RND transporter periplasmic adaptor subunit [Sulfuricella sp.]
MKRWLIMTVAQRHFVPLAHLWEREGVRETSMKRSLMLVLMATWLAAAAVQAAEVPAVLQWSQRVELSTPVSGVVQTVNAKPGDRVKKGQALLQLDDRIYAARAEEAAAAVARQKDEAAEAQRDLKRVQELYDRSVISTTELDQARLRQARAAAQFREAQARYKQEAKSRADSVLRAPFDALVVARMVEPGQAVAAGLQPQALLALAKAGEMIAHAQVSEERLNNLKVGGEVNVTVGQLHFRGSITMLGLEPAARDKNGSPLYALEVLFAPGENVLRAGGQASLTLPGR